MPEPAGTRSLEDILASIRKSLSDETVDGLVQLSAAAAAAARAEAGPAQQTATSATDPAAAVTMADALADDLLRDKLAGALSTEEVPEPSSHELSELLAEPSVSLAPPAPAEQTAAATTESTLSNLWFIRPGKPEEAPEQTGATGARTLRIDPFEDGDTASSANGDAGSTIFSRSPSQLMNDGASVSQDAPTVANVLKGAAPRLDREKIELLNKLRASNASAIEKIAKANAETDVLSETSEPDAAASEPAPVTEAVDARPVAEPEPEVAEAAPEHVPADEPAPDGEHALRTLLTLPERSTPLFGALPDGRRPIVTSAVGHLIPEGDDEPLAPPSAEIAADITDDVVPDRRASHVDPEVAGGPVAERAGAREEPGATEPDAVASEIPASLSDDQPEAATVTAGERSLEDMIAAVLEPVLHRLIEKNLEPVVQDLVRREVEKALKAAREGE